MKKILLGIFLVLFFSNIVFAQVKTPDYKDETQWTYFNCGEEFLQPNDRDYYSFHEDYRPAFVSDEPMSVTVMYKPLKRDLLEKEGDEKFVSLSKEQPWLLFFYTVNAADDHVTHLFEYENGLWKYVATLDDHEKLKDFLHTKYDL